MIIQQNLRTGTWIGTLKYLNCTHIAMAETRAECLLELVKKVNALAAKGQKNECL